MNRSFQARGLPLAIVAVALLFVRGGYGGAQAPVPPRAGTFASEIAALSEPPGYFDTDNLISNERSYLQVLPELQRRNVRGGAYIGVGPDQNFSYIADIRPDVAFIVDIRRDNLLLHLLFKALFAESATRMDYLAQLFGRATPPQPGGWRDASLEQMLAYIDGDGGKQAVDPLRARIARTIAGFGVPLTAEDIATIDRFHRRFIEAGPGLRFESIGRSPQSYYPTYRQLLLETDAAGRQRNYLAADEGFQFVKSLEARGLVIPVVGDLSGPSALAAVGRAINDRGKQLSAFYTSNVEFYLERNGTYPRFAANLARVPRTSRSVIIRSVFGRGAGSYSMLQAVDEVLADFPAPR